MPMPEQKTTLCTIVSKNYLARARALAESVRKHHPNASFDVLLVDEIENYFDPSKEPFSITLIKELDIPELPRFCFQYSILELNTAAKPTYLKSLLKKGTSKLIYLDPDTLLYSPLTRIEELLDHHSMVLTPHTTVSYPDSEEQSEVALLRAGIYNLGFLAIRNDETCRSMLDWWEKRLYSGCRADLSKGYHVDQKWMDLTPALFNGVFILREPGYNVATWNFHDHKITFENGTYFIGKDPLKFFHFSAFDPFQPERVSKYQTRYNLENIGPLKELFLDYQKTLFRHGFKETVQWPYAFESFDNGVKIPNHLRRAYLHMSGSGQSFGNPFQTTSDSSLYHWWKSQGEIMKREELTDLLNLQEEDWNSQEIESSLENLDLYDWFRRANPKPKWDGKPVTFIKRQIKYWGLQLFMQWLPPLFAKQFVLNRFFMTEIQRLKNTPSSLHR